jgi:aubergine-like protein
MTEAGKTFGIQVSEPGFYYADGSLDSFLDKIENDIKKNNKPQIVLTFLTNYEAKYYTDLKMLLYLKLGVPHQNVLRKSMNKNGMSVASNILLQINAKLGDPLWQIGRSLKEVRDRKIAIGGIAVYHKLINKKDSCAAFVGTVDVELTHYYSSAKMMPSNSQSIEPLQDMMLKWIRAWFKRNTSLPDTLIVYRDGVGEGQIVRILDMELPALNKAVQAAAAKVRPGYQPEIIFMLANKKVPQRMF